MVGWRAKGMMCKDTYERKREGKLTNVNNLSKQSDTDASLLEQVTKERRTLTVAAVPVGTLAQVKLTIVVTPVIFHPLMSELNPMAP